MNPSPSRPSRRAVPAILCAVALLALLLGLSHAGHAARAQAAPGGGQACPPPGIEITHVPPWGSTENLHGRVTCTDPADYKVAVYLYQQGWWTKPYENDRLTPVADDGTWQTDVTTGGWDICATRYAAFLVPDGYSPPAVGGSTTLPAELYDAAAGYALTQRDYPRAVQFSGYTWHVKTCPGRLDPGQNYFSDRAEDVFVDGSGRLHLRIAYDAVWDDWYASEVVMAQSLGHGFYTFTLASDVDGLDKNIVLGLFTWDDTAPAHAFREIDIEFSRWGDAADANAQYVVQPWGVPGNVHRFEFADGGGPSTHRFAWEADRIGFAGWQGTGGDPAAADETWTYTGSSTPPAGAETPRINLWLVGGAPPSDGKEAEVIVESFAFAPLPAYAAHVAYLPLVTMPGAGMVISD